MRVRRTPANMRPRRRIVLEQCSQREQFRQALDGELGHTVADMDDLPVHRRHGDGEAARRHLRQRRDLGRHAPMLCRRDADSHRFFEPGCERLISVSGLSGCMQYHD